MRTFSIDHGLVAIDVTSPDLVARVVRAFAGPNAAEAPITHRCPTCGSATHGQPLVDGHPELAISVSRSSGRQAVAVSRAAGDYAGIGIDIESITRVAAHPVVDVLLHRHERTPLERLDATARARALAELWAAKEALLKASGHGLTLELSEVHLERREAGFRAVTLPSEWDGRTSPLITVFDTGVTDLVGAVVGLRR